MLGILLRRGGGILRLYPSGSARAKSREVEKDRDILDTRGILPKKE